MITSEQFVKKWMEAYKLGENAPWVAKELDMKNDAVHSKKNWLLHSGVKLPALTKERKTIQLIVPKLNNIIREGLENER